MTERRARTGRVVGLAEGMAAAVRRRQREREPRVVVFDPTGAPKVVAPSAPGYDELLEVTAGMLALVREPRARPGPRPSAASEPAA